MSGLFKLVGLIVMWAFDKNRIPLRDELGKKYDELYPRKLAVAGWIGIAVVVLVLGSIRFFVY